MEGLCHRLHLRGMGRADHETERQKCYQELLGFVVRHYAKVCGCYEGV